MVAGITAGAVAIGFWYGYPLAKRRYNCEQESVMTTQPTEEPAATPLDIKIEQMLTEARVILPGAQALFGFQLAIVFTRSFADLPVVPMIMHEASLLLVHPHRGAVDGASRIPSDRLRWRSVGRHVPGWQCLGDSGDHSVSAWTCGRHICCDQQNHGIARHRGCRRRRSLYIVDRALARLPIGSSW